MARHGGKGVFAATALAKVLSDNVHGKLELRVGPPAYDVANGIMYLPAIPADDVPEEALTILRAYLGHEAGERKHSKWVLDPRIRQGGPGLAALCNGINDARIDRLMADQFPGVGFNIQYAVRKDVHELLDRNRVEPVQPSVNIIAVLVRYVGEGFLTYDDCVREFPQLEKYLKKVESYLRGLDLSSEEACIRQACEMYKLLKEPEPKQEQPQPQLGQPQTQPDEEPDTSEAGEGEGIQSPDAEQEGPGQRPEELLEGSGESLTRSGGSEGGQQQDEETDRDGEGEGDSEGDDAGEGEGEGLGDEGDGEGEGEEGESEGSSEGADESHSDDGDEESVGGEAGSEGEDDLAESTQGGSSSSPSGEDLGESQDQQVGEDEVRYNGGESENGQDDGTRSHAAAAHDPEEAETLPDSAETDFDADKALEKRLLRELFGDNDNSDPYSQIYGDVKQYTYDDSCDRVVTPRPTYAHEALNKQFYARPAQVLETKLRQALTVPAPRMRRGLDKGEVDERNLWRAGMGDPFIMRRRVRQESSDVAVSLSIDESYSMFGTRIGLCRDLAYTWNEALGRLGIPLEVTGWTTGSQIRGRDLSKVYRTEAMDYRVYKKFDERYTDEKVLKRLNMMSARGNTPTAEGILFAAKRLAERRERRKLLFVLTDGQPGLVANGFPQVHEQFIHTVLRRCTQAGIEVIGVGIGVELSEYFKHFIRVDQLDDLKGKTSDELLKVLRAGALDIKRA